MKVQLAGSAGSATDTILSLVGVQLLRMFNTREACTLRLVCTEFVGAVCQQQWEDRTTPIRGSLRAWRACFPRARCANVSGRRKPLLDADFEHLAGLRMLNMAGSRSVTDAALAHLHGIHTLNLRNCQGIKDAGIAHLGGVRVLDVTGCLRLTGACFANLAGTERLKLGGQGAEAVSRARAIVGCTVMVDERMGSASAGRQCSTCGGRAQVGARGEDGRPYCSAACRPADVGMDLAAGLLCSTCGARALAAAGGGGRALL
jgi:endogenous inhibitor of DNA gyrase (YacG/DUF329 family)